MVIISALTGASVSSIDNCVLLTSKGQNVKKESLLQHPDGIFLSQSSISSISSDAQGVTYAYDNLLFSSISPRSSLSNTGSVSSNLMLSQDTLSLDNVFHINNAHYAALLNLEHFSKLLARNIESLHQEMQQHNKFLTLNCPQMIKVLDSLSIKSDSSEEWQLLVQQLKNHLVSLRNRDKSYHDKVKELNEKCESEFMSFQRIKSGDYTLNEIAEMFASSQQQLKSGIRRISFYQTDLNRTLQEVRSQRRMLSLNNKSATSYFTKQMRLLQSLQELPCLIVTRSFENLWLEQFRQVVFERLLSLNQMSSVQRFLTKRRQSFDEYVQSVQVDGVQYEQISVLPYADIRKLIIAIEDGGNDYLRKLQAWIVEVLDLQLQRDQMLQLINDILIVYGQESEDQATQTDADFAVNNDKTYGNHTLDLQKQIEDLKQSNDQLQRQLEEYKNLTLSKDRKISSDAVSIVSTSTRNVNAAQSESPRLRVMERQRSNPMVSVSLINADITVPPFATQSPQQQDASLSQSGDITGPTALLFTDSSMFCHAITLTI
ncbi:hypothetical protein MP228_000475 [Amoeboaphelidium protococcarum]|nr:hypothetical protein MP228_000475 [Amoeboaphelidium protococcarum]